MRNLIIALLLALPTIAFTQFSYYENMCDTEEKRVHDIRLTNEFDWYVDDAPKIWCSTANVFGYKTVGTMLKTAKIYDNTLGDHEIVADTKIYGREPSNGYLLRGTTNNAIDVIAWGNTPLECIYNMDMLLSTGQHPMALMSENRIPR